MSTQTTNLHLTKPSDNERANNDVINANMDTIDAAVGAVDVAQDGSLQSQIDALNGATAKTDVSANIRSDSANANRLFEIAFTCENSSSAHYGHAMALNVSSERLFIWCNNCQTVVKEYNV